MRSVPVTELKPLAPPLFEGDVAHYWKDDGEGGGMIVSQADVSVEIEHNKQLQTNTPRILKADFWPEAHIPDIIILKWLNEDIETNSNIWGRRLETHIPDLSRG